MDEKKAIGSGLNGDVYRGELIGENGIKEVAVKQFTASKFTEALHEIINYSRLYESHPNVLALQAV